MGAVLSGGEQCCLVRAVLSGGSSAVRGEQCCLVRAVLSGESIECKAALSGASSTVGVKQHC